MNDFINKDILEYSEIKSQQEPSLLKELNKETHLKVLNPRMLSGAFQGRLISMISFTAFKSVQLSWVNRILSFKTSL